MHRWWRGSGGPRQPPNNRKVMLVCAVSFNRCETLLTETSKFWLKHSRKKKKKKLVDGSITVKVNRREEERQHARRSYDNKSTLEKWRSNSFSSDASNIGSFYYR